MKRLAALTLAASACASTFAGPNVAVSVAINQPGVYGRIDVGAVPPPPVVYAQPVVVAPAPVAVYQSPIYLYVPVVYQQNWPQYCGRYNACGQPVYFVREDWYQQHYMPAHHQGRDDDHGKGHGRGHGKGHDKD